MPLLLRGFGKFLAYVAVLFVVSVCKLSKACSADARSEDSKTTGRRIESATAKVSNFKVYLYLLFFSFQFLAQLCRFLASFAKQASPLSYEMIDFSP